MLTAFAHQSSGGSSNGRTAAFGVADLGSNPSPPAIKTVVSFQFPVKRSPLIAGQRPAPLAIGRPVAAAVLPRTDREKSPQKLKVAVTMGVRL